MAAARKAIAEHGELVKDRYGMPKVNPACALEKARRICRMRTTNWRRFTGIDARERPTAAREDDETTPRLVPQPRATH